MESIFLGDYIQQRRKDLGLTQAQLSEGICDTTTISRMERGEQTLRHSTVTALLERLGTSYDQYVLLSREEIEIAALQREITAASVQFQQGEEPGRSQARTQVLEKLGELEKVAKSGGIEDTPVIRQYLLSVRVALRTLEGSISPEEEIAALLEAIRITVPRFNPAKINSRPYYSLEEVRLISHLALAYSHMGNHKKAVGIFSQLHTYVTEHNHGLAKSGGGMPLVAHNYARELAVRKQYEDALDIAEEGRAACVRYSHYQFLPGLLHIMAECQHFLGNDKESKELYDRACRLYQEFGNDRDRSTLQKEAQKYHIGRDSSKFAE